MSASASPVRKTVDVACAPDDAFRLFTEEIGAWWPLETHSITAMESGDSAPGAVLEPRVGGELYEVMPDGSRGHWGTVLAWDPPSRLVLAWKPNAGRPAATEVEVTFRDDGRGGTRVELEHRGWERLGADAAESRDEYDRGWTPTLGRFASHVERS